MGRFEEYVDRILTSGYMGNARKDGLRAEMLDHLYMSKKELMDKGFAEEDAEQQAVQKFGEVNNIKKEFKKVFHPLKRLAFLIHDKKIVKESVEWAFTILIAVFISLTIRSYVFAQTEVRQSSMQNTLFEGQRLVELKAGYWFSNPKRGDIVVINREAPSGIIDTFETNTVEFVQGFYDKKDVDEKRLIKRIIGLPGDTIDIRNGNVYINGKEYNESYVKGVTFDNGMKFPLVVPAEKYFVMGDNREVSWDSRNLGFIDYRKIEGKAVLRTWPFGRFGNIYH